MARFPTVSAALPVIFAFTSLLSSTAATPPTALEPRQIVNVWSEGWPACFLGHRCPGLWPNVDNNTNPILNTTLFTMIYDAGLMARAAVNAIDAPHFDYFFERNDTVTTLVEKVFTNLAACAEGRECDFSLLFIEEQVEDPKIISNRWCQWTTYGYAPQGNTDDSNLIFICPESLGLPRNPIPCTSDGNPSLSLGYAVIRTMVQSRAMRNPTNESTLFDGLSITGITEMGNPRDWELKDLGWGTKGDGLMGAGVGNAANWAAFATLSWDLGYGSSPWTGKSCGQNWTKFANAQGLKPIS